MATDRLAEIQSKLATYRRTHSHPQSFACCSAHAVADEVPFLLGLVAELDAKLQIAERQTRERDEQLTERTRQLNGLLDSLSFDEKAVPA